MDIFNAPTREHSTVRRDRTNTPLQALVTMNDPQFVEASRHLAQRAMREAGYDFDQRLDYMTTRLMARDFTAPERAVARRTWDRFVDLYRADAGEARELLDVGESAHDAALPMTESAAWTMLASQPDESRRGPEQVGRDLSPWQDPALLPRPARAPAG